MRTLHGLGRARHSQIHNMLRETPATDGRMNVLDRFRLDGKRLFITGGSRGFGRVIALARGRGRRRHRA